MAERRERLKKLVEVQQQLKALHETRYAGYVSGAARALEEAEELARRADAPASLAGLFPDVYNRGISAALVREKALQAKAKLELAKVATAGARVKLVDRTYRTVAAADERHKEESEGLELAQRPPPATRK